MRRLARLAAIGIVSVAAVLSTPLAPASLAAGTGNGTIAGAIGASKATSAWVKPVAVASRLDANAAVRAIPISASGTFRAKVPGGLWAVTVPVMRGGKLRYVTTVLPVTSGKTAQWRSKSLAGTAVPVIRIASGPWRATTPIPDPIDPTAATLGRQTLMVAGISSTMGSAPCADGSARPSVAVVEFRGPGGRFADVMAEVKAGQTRFASAQARSQAKQALRRLTLWKPNATITANVAYATVNGKVVETDTVRVTGSLDQAVLFEKSYSGDPQGTFFFDVVDQAGRDIAQSFCQDTAPDSTPAGLHVKATATVSGSDSDAKAALKLSTEYDVWARAGEPTNYDLAAPIVWTVDTTTFAALGSCPKVSTGATQFAASTASGGAALDSGKVKVFVSSVFQVDWQETPPPDSCTSSGVLALMLAPTNLTVPLGGTGQSTGSALPGQSFTITATVTPLTKRP